MTKFAAYVVQILLYGRCKFGYKICYSNWDDEFFLRDCFLLVQPVHIQQQKVMWLLTWLVVFLLFWILSFCGILRSFQNLLSCCVAI